MAISRRLFISTGLLCVVGAVYVKGFPDVKELPIFSNDIESFFGSYDIIIPVEDSSDAFGDAAILEKKLVSLLSTEGIRKTIIIVNKMVQNDYQMSKIRLMNGWIVSEVEFGLLILRNRYV